MSVNSSLDTFLKTISTNQISQDRKEHLKNLASAFSEKIQGKEILNLNFICTHNSRRSQIAEIVFRLCAHHFQLDGFQVFSSGTEETALNERVTVALRKHGFQVELVEERENPIYAIFFSDQREEEPAMFSKTFEDESIDTPFSAIMVCGDAEENCPFISTADDRYSLKYLDPKYADETPDEGKVYAEKVVEIGTEIYFLCQLLSEKTAVKSTA